MSGSLIGVCNGIVWEVIEGCTVEHEYSEGGLGFGSPGRGGHFAVRSGILVDDGHDGV